MLAEGQTILVIFKFDLRSFEIDLQWMFQSVETVNTAPNGASFTSRMTLAAFNEKMKKDFNDSRFFVVGWLPHVL